MGKEPFLRHPDVRVNRVCRAHLHSRPYPIFFHQSRFQQRLQRLVDLLGGMVLLELVLDARRVRDALVAQRHLVSHHGQNLLQQGVL